MESGPLAAALGSGANYCYNVALGTVYDQTLISGSGQWGVVCGEDKGVGRMSVCGLLEALPGTTRRLVEYCTESELVHGFTSIVLNT
jgi:hypothetical protein